MSGTRITDQQVRLYMKHRKHHPQKLAAAKAGMNERTARRVEHDGGLASQQPRRYWRSRPDPFADVWDSEVVPLLRSAPRLKAITLLRKLQEDHPKRFPDSMRRTLERHIRQWRALEGPNKEVFFPQTYPPGARGLSDFTHMDKLGVTIGGVLFNHLLYHFVLVSLRRVLLGLAMALAVGVPLGLLVGGAARVDAAVSPAFQFLRMISPLSWMPLVVMVLGVGDRPVLFLLAFAGVWPILLNTAAGVRNLDPRWITLARSLAATRWEMLMRVVLPGVVGSVLTGLRLSIGIVWIVLVPAEMLGVNAGLGYFILDTRDRLAYSELLATVLVIGLLGFLLDSCARWLQRWWAPA